MPKRKKFTPEDRLSFGKYIVEKELTAAESFKKFGISGTTHTKSKNEYKSHLKKINNEKKMSHKKTALTTIAPIEEKEHFAFLPVSEHEELQQLRIATKEQENKIIYLSYQLDMLNAELSKFVLDQAKQIS